jgi:hypothetical protein
MLALGNMEFIMALPFTLAYADTQVRSETKDIVDIQNAMMSGCDVFYGVTKRRTWGSSVKGESNSPLPRNKRRSPRLSDLRAGM